MIIFAVNIQSSKDLFVLTWVRGMLYQLTKSNRKSFYKPVICNKSGINIIS